MGFSFLAKGLQPFTVLPALALVYLVARPDRRGCAGSGRLLAAGAALVVGAGWWVLAVAADAGGRPSLHRRLDQQQRARPGLRLQRPVAGCRAARAAARAAGGGFSGSTGIGRLFNSLNGGQIAWLLPAALLGDRRAGRGRRRAAATDRTRAAVIIWGGWLLVTGARAQLRRRHHPHLLHGRAGPGDRGAGRHRRRVVLWRHARRRRRPAGAGRRRRSSPACWSYDAAAPHAGLAPVARLRCVLIASRRSRRRRCSCRPARLRRGLVAVAAVAGVVALGGGSAAYALDDRVDRAHRLAPRRPDRRAASGGFGGRGRSAASRRRRPGPAVAGRRPRRPAGGSGGGSGGRPGGSRRLRPAAAAGRRRRPTGRRHRRRRRTGGARRRRRRATASANAALTALLKATTTKWAAAAIGSQTAGAARARQRQGRHGHRRLQRQRRSHRRWRSSRSCVADGKIALLHRWRQRRRRPGGGGGNAGSARSPPGSRRTTRPPPSAARPSTT